ncbi:MAG: hypothetical protein JW969_14015 [Spirochaetales bacterium]|nr:hypothetical protein [Spirochaetales bacterium]
MEYSRQNGKAALILLITVIFVWFGGTAWAQYNYGKNPKYPITFYELKNWIGDPRNSMRLFEETLEKDIFALRLDYQYCFDPSYFMMDSGEVYQANISHITFQGMFWGPIFASAIWLPPAILIDILADAEGQIAAIPIAILIGSFEALKEQSREKVPFSSIFRINVLFTTDLLYLDFKRFDINYFAQPEATILGRTYSGLCFKVLELFSVFAGFSFIHFPHLEGFQDFIGADKDFSTQGGILVYAEDGSVLFETRAKIFLYNNLFNCLTIETLLNLAENGLLDMFGVGFSFKNFFDFFLEKDLLGAISPLLFNANLSYLEFLKYYEMRIDNHFYLTPNFACFYRWDFGVQPWTPLNYAKLGLDITIPVVEEEDFSIDIALRGYGTAFQQNDVYKFGYYADIGLVFGKLARLTCGIGYNSDETMNDLNFMQENLMLFVGLEIGMEQSLADENFMLNSILESDFWD